MQVGPSSRPPWRSRRRAVDVQPEIMIPLVGTVNELPPAGRCGAQTASPRIIEKTGVEVDYMVGTMIEIPRGALTADEIAEEAEFFSFGTNDLTQMTFGSQPRRRRGQASCRTTSSRRSCPSIRSSRSTSVASASWCRSRYRARAAPRAPTSSSVSAVSTAATRSSVVFFHKVGLELRQLLALPRARLRASPWRQVSTGGARVRRGRAPHRCSGGRRES
jgi:hypothetical protein